MRIKASLHNLFCLASLLVAGLVACDFSNVQAQGTLFTYQGRLISDGVPANGVYDLSFSIYPAASGGSQVSWSITNAATVVSNGLFIAFLDFGGIFNGPNFWLEIGVRTNGGGIFKTLAPRQAITSVPYAMASLSASNLLGQLPAAQLSGTLPAVTLPSNVLTNGAQFVSLSGAFNGNAAGLTNINASQLSTGTIASSMLPSNVVQLGASYQLMLYTNVSIYAPDPFGTNWFGSSGMDITNHVRVGGGRPTNFMLQGSYSSVSTVSPIEGTCFSRFGFELDGDRFGGVVGAYGTSVWLRMNNGDWTLLTQTDGSGNAIYFEVILPYQNVWKVELAGQGIALGKIFYPKTATINPLLPYKKRMIVFGDSFTDGGGGVGGAVGFCNRLADKLDAIDVWPMGAGSTGYFANGRFPTNGVGRMQTDVITNHPEIILFALGINDNPAQSNDVYTAAVTCYSNALAVTTNVLVCGPFWPSNNGGAQSISMVISNAAATLNLPIIFPAWSADNSWFTGFWTSPGSGNAPQYIVDGTHPTVDGHKFIARNLLPFISRAVSF